MNSPTTLLAGFFVVAAVQLVLAIPVQKRLDNPANATCIVKRNEDGLMLQVYELRTEYGMVQFTNETEKGTEWNVVPYENSTELFRLRNVQYNQYLAVWPDNLHFIGTYPESHGNFSNYLWSLEEKSEGLGGIKHNNTNNCITIAEFYSPVCPVCDPYYIPIMFACDLPGTSTFEISCSDN